MAKLLYSATMSLDGFIAGPGGDMSWLTEHLGPNPMVGELASGVAAARAAAGDKYVNILGADIARQCLDAGVLDEILVLVAPVLLGDGVRLFDRPGGTKVKLERISLTQTPQVTNLWLRVA